MEEQKKLRVEWLDSIRGITLISMIIYHAVWDIVYIAKVDWEWYHSDGAYVWQQSICWVFILLSGFCWSLGRSKWKNGLEVSAAGILVSIITCIFTPEERIVFGVLTFLGAAMLFMIPLEKILCKVPDRIGVVASFLIFLFTRELSGGYLGIAGIKFISLPRALYHQGYVMTFLGWKDAAVFTTDYFPIVPWIFLFITGYFIYQIFRRRQWLEKKIFSNVKFRPFGVMGRHSLFIYLLHQPVIYAGVLVGQMLF